MADAVEDIQYRTIIIKFNFNSAPWRAVIVALILSSSPSNILRQVLALSRREYAQECVCREHPLNQHFNLAAAGFTPKQAAGITRVLLKTRRSPGLSLSINR